MKDSKRDSIWVTICVGERITHDDGTVVDIEEFSQEFMITRSTGNIDPNFIRSDGTLTEIARGLGASLEQIAMDMLA